MKKISSFLTKLQDIIVASSCAAFICVVLLAVLVRYTQIWSIGWPDELSRYLMIWMTFIAAGAGARKNAHFSIEIAYAVLPKKYHWLFIVFRTVVADAVLATICYYSIGVTQKQMLMDQLSPAMHIPMWFMYLAIPIGCFLFMLQGTIFAVEKIKELRTEVRNA